MASSARFEPPVNFDFSEPSKWPDWQQRFLRFRVLTKLDKESQEIQVSTLIYCLGNEAENIFKSFNLEAQASKNWETVINRFDEYFIPKRNIIYERKLFHECEQQIGETVEQFVRNLYEVADKCGYADGKEEQIRDQLVVGVLDKSVTQKLCLIKDLTLQKAIAIARNTEMVKGQTSDKPNVDAVHTSSGSRRPWQKGSTGQSFRGTGRQNAHSTGKNMINNCKFCAKAHQMGQCPAFSAYCQLCGKKGHFATRCYRLGRKVAEVSTSSVQEPESSNAEADIDFVEDNLSHFFIGEAVVQEDCVETSQYTDEVKPWTVKIEVNDSYNEVLFKIDTGADVSIMNIATYNKMLPKPKLYACNVKLNSPGGVISTVGQFIARGKFRKKPINFRVIVVTGEYVNNLLSRTAAVNLGLIKLLEVDEFSSTEIDPSLFGDVGFWKNTEPVKIELSENHVPYVAHSARRIPIPWIPKVKQKLAKMEEAGVIEKITEPTDWCSPMLVVPKRNDDIRLCVDLRKLNLAVKRERHYLPVLTDVLHQLTESSIFTTLDASSGYWALPLDSESRKLTTFITPFGRFCFTRLPYGINSASEIYQRKMEELLAGIEGVHSIIDDIIIHGKTKEEHDFRLAQVLERLKKAGIKLNKAKCRFRQPTVDFFGQTVTTKGVHPQIERVEAILDLPPPENKSDLRSILGMITYLGRYMHNLSDRLAPLNELLKDNSVFLWETPQQTAFDEVKEMIIKAPILGFYDPSFPTLVSADSSSYGLGGVIMQFQDQLWKPIAFCSRTLTPAEKNYAPIEREALASVFACEKFRIYLQGLPKFRLITDHKPWVPLVNNRDLDQVPVRLQQFLMRLLPFNTIAEYVAGKELVISDCLSRSPRSINDVEIEISQEIEECVKSWEDIVPISSKKMEQILSETSKDPQLSIIRTYIRQGWPEVIRSVHPSVSDYCSVRHDLYESNGFIARKGRIVIPRSMQAEILEKIHAGHQGQQKCKQRASQSVWWPGISKQIENLINNCRHCDQNKPTQRHEPMIPGELPEGPWQKLAMDLFQFNNKNYLVVIDCYSRYIEIAQLNAGTTTKDVLRPLTTLYEIFGLPLLTMSDNGPQFISKEFLDFSAKMDIKHITVSPRNPQANGMVERAVQTAKSILRQSNPSEAIRNYRATPHTTTGASPAQLLMGRNIRTSLPTLPHNLKPEWPDQDKIRAKDTQQKLSQAKFYNRRHGVRALAPLKPGDPVTIKIDSQKQWNDQGTIKSLASTPRSYMIDTPKGEFRRNRRHLSYRKWSEPVSSDNLLDLEDFDDFEPRAEPTADITHPDNTAPGTNVRTRSGRIVRPPCRLISEN